MTIDENHFYFIKISTRIVFYIILLIKKNEKRNFEFDFKSQLVELKILLFLRIKCSKIFDVIIKNKYFEAYNNNKKYLFI